MTQKGRPRWSVALLSLIAVTGLVSACGSKSAAQSSKSTTLAKNTSTTLDVAFDADTGSIDPDIFYATEGLMVTNSVYDGLLQYASNSTTIVSDLAALPTVSPDKLTYTFTLHSGVKFHDGTAFNSAAVAASFARRTAVNQGPAYMLAKVASVQTPDPLTVVVKLSSPVNAFLDYLASPFGPKMLSPTAIKAHTVGNDHAEKWLGSHDAGTGAYTISAFEPEQKYELTSFPGYWGGPPAFTKVNISVQPNVAAQQAELQRGELDMIMHGLQPQAIVDLAKKSGLTVHTFPTELKTLLYVNPHLGPFTSVAARKALRRALDKKLLATPFGGAATISTSVYPAGELPTSLSNSTVPYDPSALKDMLGSLPSKKVDIGYDPTDPRNQQEADLLQAELQSDGFTSTDRAIPIGEIFGLEQNPDKAPDILIQTTNPDAAHPDTWARIYMSTEGGANILKCSDPALDNALDKALAATDTAAEQQGYAKAGDLIVANGCFIDVADVKDTIVARSSLTGFYHVPSMPWTVKLADLKNG